MAGSLMRVPSAAEAIFRSLIRPPPAPGEAAEAELRRYIIEHNLQPGDKLPSEAELAQGLGSSRLVVREALSSLEALGLLDSRAGSGWYVRPFDVAAAARIFAGSLAFHPRPLLDLLEVRRSVEADVAAKAAEALTPHDLAVLDALVDRMRWRAARCDPFVAEDSEFHRRIAAASGNLVALALVDLYWRVVEAAYASGLPHLGAAELPPAAEEHAELLEALRRARRPEVLRAARAHHDRGQRSIIAWLAAQETGSTANDTNAIQAAVQAALLWREPGQ